MTRAIDADPADTFGLEDDEREPVPPFRGILFAAIPATQRWRFLGELPRTFTLRALEAGHARGLWECEACQYLQVFVSTATHEAVNQIPCRLCLLVRALTKAVTFEPLPGRGDVLRDVGLDSMRRRKGFR